MSGVSINAGELSLEISKALEQYTKEVSEAIEVEKEKTAKAIVEDLKQSTAWTDRTKGAKGYRKGFAVKKEGEKGNQTFIIHNKNKPQIAHLLELGHAKRGGGRVDARPHWRPIGDKHIKAYEKRIEQIIQNGG